MKLLIVFFSFIFYTIICSAQADTSELKRSIAALDSALLKKDSVALVQLLHPSVSFGHSNGWFQTKWGVIIDLREGYLVYDSLITTDLQIKSEEDWANARMNVFAKGKVKGKEFRLQLHVLQVWKKMNENWQLIARQSAKLN